MFGPFASQTSRMRKNARNWLHLAEKVYHYRRDQLKESQAVELLSRMKELRGRLADRADASRLKLGVESLEHVLREVGGKIYPKSSLVENVEFLLVAGIILFGIRAYFVQPFKIPTNSMWPSYYGMTHEVFESPEEEPGKVRGAFRLLAYGAGARRIDAPVAGNVRIPMVYNGSRATLPYSVVKGRKWLVLPTYLREYRIFVDNREVRIRVPDEFDFDRVAWNAFFEDEDSLGEAVRRAYRANQVDETHMTIESPRGSRAMRVLLIDTGREVRRGERVLAFDVLTGDQLFVDRMSYHFVRPKVGQGFVFRTRNIEGLNRADGMPDDKYYIKRLVGTPGDILEIHEPTLYRNGNPITGSRAFEKNSLQEDDFPGYRNHRLLAEGQSLQIPEGHYFALGDNSPHSLDSRDWGNIPGYDVVGRPLFIYYPFTRRWGPAP